MKGTDEADVVLVGAGIMSATLGAMLRELEPGWSQIIFERLDGPAEESSSPWNNAGTGHSALCELNYTPEVKGKIQTAKAIAVNEKFQISRQFWSHQVDKGVLPHPEGFIHPVPHVSFGQGDTQVAYLRKRYEALNGHPLFPNMKFTDDPDEFAQFLPLMAKGRVLGIQFDTLFTDGLYERGGAHAVAMADRIRTALIEKGYTHAIDSPTNQIFPALDAAQLARLSAHVSMSFWEKQDDVTVMRIATSWATREEDVERLIALL